MTPDKVEEINERFRSIAVPAETLARTEAIRVAAAEKLLPVRYVLHFAENPGKTLADRVEVWTGGMQIPDRELSEEEEAAFVAKLGYLPAVPQSVFAKHVCVTVGRLRKILTPDCYYRPTPKATDLIWVSDALALLDRAGLIVRLPVHREKFGVRIEE